ncbi:MAG: molybdopterin molybdotransferase MoeA [Bauldia sp.]|nr:molybdopterin molybdotransferase MoeA [Bauldia sp.]
MTLLPVDEALRRVLAGVQPTPAETVPIGAAAGRTLAGPLVAVRTQPPFAASAMDGYALRLADATTGAALTLIGESAAGRGFAGRVGAGETVRIFTGAPIPDGADAILIQENAAASDDRVEVREPPRAGQYIRPAGLDFASGATLLPAGRKLGTRELALAAASGVAHLTVRRCPRIAFLSVGDELVPPGTLPGPYQIVAASALGLAHLAAAAGAEATDLGIAPDRTETVAALAARAAADGTDVLVTMGGASVGAYDIMRPALGEAGMTLDFWRIAMRPGRPLIHGRLGAMAVLGLPGNPVSSLVCALLFLRPLIGALLGEPTANPREPATLGADLPANDDRDDYLRARLAPAKGALPVVTALPRQDSSMLSTLAEADCLLIRPAHAAPARAGDPCEIIRL